MSVDAITLSTVRDAVRAVRYGRSLRNSALAEFDCVELAMRTSRLPDTWQAREWAVSHVLDGIATATIERLRGDGGDGAVGVSKESTAASDVAELRWDYSKRHP